MEDAADVARDRATGFRTEPVSFARRGGRLTERQQDAWDDLYPTHVVDVPRSGLSTSVDPAYALDLEALFGRRAPLVVEIGSGRGEAMVAAATEHAAIDFLALEVYVPGVAQTLVSVQHGGLTNVRLAIVNATEALDTMLEAASVRELWTWFPDPWHKKRHHKRRLVTVPFTALVERVLEPGGVWRMATDWAEYAEQMAGVLDDSPHLTGGITPRYPGRVVTRFEAKGTTAGRVIHDLAATPTPTLAT